MSITCLRGLCWLAPWKLPVTSLTNRVLWCVCGGTERSGQAPRYDWDAKVQGLVLGSFFYGYIVTVLPGGVLAEQLGPKWLIGVGVLVTSLLSLVLPVAAGAHHIIVVGIRVLQGLAEVLALFLASRFLARCRGCQRVGTISCNSYCVWEMITILMPSAVRYENSL